MKGYFKDAVKSLHESIPRKYNVFLSCKRPSRYCSRLIYFAFNSRRSCLGQCDLLNFKNKSLVLVFQSFSFRIDSQRDCSKNLSWIFGTRVEKVSSETKGYENNIEHVLLFFDIKTTRTSFVLVVRILLEWGDAVGNNTGP